MVKILDVLTLSSIHDTAVRSYYSYELLSELIRAQRKGMLDLVGSVVGAFASTVGVVAFFQIPQFGTAIAGVVLLILAAIVGAWLYVRKQIKEEEALSQMTYLGIVMDELLKDMTEIKLITECDDKDNNMGKWFTKNLVLAMSASRRELIDIKGKLMKMKDLEKALTDYGWTTEHLDETLKEAEELIRLNR